MGTFYYVVVSIDGDYANLKRVDIESDELKLVARALLPPGWESERPISSRRKFLGDGGEEGSANLESEIKVERVSQSRNIRGLESPEAK